MAGKRGAVEKADAPAVERVDGASKIPSNAAKTDGRCCDVGKAWAGVERRAAGSVLSGSNEPSNAAGAWPFPEQERGAWPKTVLVDG